MNHIIGLDIGGTKIYVANYDTELSLISDHQTPTESHKGAERIYQNILAAIKQVQTPEAKAVGIAWAGFVDKDGQTIRKGPNISGFEDFPLGQRLQKELGLPVVIGNDARLFALAECHTRTPISECLLGIILGTGVGSGLIIKGEIFKGAHNFAGEIGHIKPGTPQEIEDFIAGPGMTTFLQKTFPIKTLSDMEIYFQEDEVSPQLLANIKPRLQMLTNWLSNLALIFDPSEIVIGGGAGLHFWKHFHHYIQAEVDKNLKEYPTDARITFSQLRNAGSLGAAILARKTL